MPIVILQLPDAKDKTEIRPQECPYCGGETFQRWGKVRRSPFLLHAPVQSRCDPGTKTWKIWAQWTKPPADMELDRRYTTICTGWTLPTVTSNQCNSNPGGAFNGVISW